MRHYTENSSILHVDTGRGAASTLNSNYLTRHHEKARVGIVALLVFASLLAGCIGQVVEATSKQNLTYAQRFDAVWQALADNYADPQMHGADWNALKRTLRPQAEKAKDEAAFDAIIAKLTASLHDPMTFYVSPAEMAKAAKEQAPEDRLDIVGVGILLGSTPDGYILVREVLPKGPAAKAGVKEGDRITAIDAKPLKSLSVAEVAQRIRGKKGTKVTLELLAPDNTKRNVVLTRADVRFTATVKAQVLPGKIGYLYLPGGSDGFESKVLSQLRKLHRTEGLILDLRSGWSTIDLSHMTPMLKIAALFTDKPIGALISREGLFLLAPQLQWGTDSEKSWLRSLLTPPPTAMDVYKKPIVCIVDETSTWEILAKGLKDTGRAAIVGRTTATGKGALATGLELIDGSGLSVTATYYASPKGEALTNGVKPDVIVPLNLAYLAARYKGQDPDIAAAKELLQKMMAKK